MGKVWLKTRYDNEMRMDIPHNVNFANAMFGFRDLGAEIIPYHTLDEILDRVDRDDIVLDYLDQCSKVFSKYGVTADIPDYPPVLKEFMGRNVWYDTIDSISADESKWSAGYFVKPIRNKAWTRG